MPGVAAQLVLAKGNDWIVSAEWGRISRLVAGRSSLRSIDYPCMIRLRVMKGMFIFTYTFA